MMGTESQGMILMAEDAEGKVEFCQPGCGMAKWDGSIEWLSFCCKNFLPDSSRLLASFLASSKSTGDHIVFCMLYAVDQHQGHFLLR
jgi:tRNA-binding EMAP/Myf-like protein